MSDPSPTRSKRLQNSSCLRCRTHKKKCDARQRSGLGYAKCSRCDRHGHKCFVDSDVQDAIQQKNTKASTSPSASAAKISDRVTDTSTTPTSHVSVTEDDLSSAAQAHHRGPHHTGHRAWQLSHQRKPRWPTASISQGPFTTAMMIEETTLLEEFMAVAWVQFPVLDMDTFYCRYKFNAPEALPRYLLDTVLAIGSLYSARRLFGSLTTIPEAFARFERAKHATLDVVYSENSVEGIQALMLLTFHWPGEYSSYERQMMTAMAAAKIRLLKLHTLEGYVTFDSRRTGLLRIMTWLNFVNNIFSPEGPSCPTRMDIPLPCPTDWEYMAIELLTGKTRVTFGIQEATFLTLILTCLANLCPIADESRTIDPNDRAANLAIVSRLDEWTKAAYPALDLRLISLLDVIGGPEQALVIVNFSYLLLLFTAQYRLSQLDHHQHHHHSPHTTDQSTENEKDKDTETGNGSVVSHGDSNIAPCLRTIETVIGLFEQLWALRRLMNTTQNVRYQFYSIGACLQTLSSQFPETVNVTLVERWEKCFEAAEAVWGASLGANFGAAVGTGSSGGAGVGKLGGYGGGGMTEEVLRATVSGTTLHGTCTKTEGRFDAT